MNKLATLLVLLLTSGMAAAQQMDMPLTAEDAIMMQELEWAEKAMEGYKRKTGHMPIRSPISASHVHTEEWRQESINIFPQGSSASADVPSRNLRGRQDK
jgi:hypothetical protein